MTLDKWCMKLGWGDGEKGMMNTEQGTWKFFSDFTSARLHDFTKN
ncbi:MAG: hypothetical protein RQ761_06625 [Bacteroidales bacterium]|nr:hypothetical protein [Bacteroidales bacterium]